MVRGQPRQDRGKRGLSMVRSEKVISRKHCIQLMAHPNCHFITDKGNATLNTAQFLIKMYSPSYGAALLHVCLVLLIPRTEPWPRSAAGNMVLKIVFLNSLIYFVEAEV